MLCQSHRFSSLITIVLLMNMSEIPSCINRHHYEALGAPIVLYRHSSSYLNVDQSDTDSLFKLLKGDDSDFSPKDDKHIRAASLRNPAVDAIPSAYPNQPWGRTPPLNNSDGSRLTLYDTIALQTHLLHADRARTRYYIDGLHQATAEGLKKLSKVAKVSDKGEKVIDPDKRVPIRRNNFDVKLKRAPRDVISHFNANHLEYQINPRYPYVNNLVDRTKKLLPIAPMLVARIMRHDMRHSSPKDGYCTPFLLSAVRYCSTYDENEDKTRLRMQLPKRSYRKKDKQIMSEDAEPADDHANDIDDDSSSSWKKDMSEDVEPADNHANDIDDDSSSSSSAFSENHDEMDQDNDLRTFKSYKRRRAPGKFIFRSKVIQPFPKPRRTCFSPQFYGNCLSILPCPCDKNANCFDRCYSQFLFHPMGHSVTVTRINLPESKYTPSVSCKKLPIVDVGDQVLQLTPSISSSNYSTSDCRGQCWSFIARTSLKIIFLLFESSGEHEATGHCTVSFQLKRMTQIDLPKIGDSSYIPLQLSVRAEKSHPLISPYSTFASISGLDPSSPYDESKTNVIHHIIVNESGVPQIKEHEIGNLHTISLLEFSGLHPLVLWSAARSIGTPPYIEGPFQARVPTAGYGHSLYSIDLRSSNATFTWSPSRMEFCMERVHSVSGIFPDACNPHYLYVSSISAGGKTWKIDCRMNSRSLCSWSLPGLCDDYKPTGSFAGVYGFGTIMTMPMCDAFTLNRKQPLPLLSQSKSPGSYGFQLLQEPNILPRFATQCLDLPACPDGIVDCPQTFATSTVFKHADSSPGSFMTGIAAFYTPLSLLLDEVSVDDLGYGLDPPSDLLCVLTATSIGDIYGHTLIENRNNVEKRSLRYDDLPAGTSAIPVPSNISIDRDGSDIQPQICLWHLSNTFPATSSSIMKQTDSKKSHCRSFITINHHHLNKSIDKPTCEHTDVRHHTFNETYLGEKGNTPTPLQLPLDYIGSESLNDITATKPSPVFDYDDVANESSGSKGSMFFDLKDDTIDHLRNLWK
jgi:hypothetical protein